MSGREEKELIKKRASYKGRLTAFTNYLNDLKQPLSPSQVHELQLRIGKMEILYTQYDEIQMRLECLVDDINSQLPDRNEFEAIYYKYISTAQDILNQNMHTVDADKLSVSRISKTNLVKLPTIQLPKFNGCYENWLEFRDTFTSLIHSNEEIDYINKFHYLRASVEGAAAIIIQSIEFSAANYTVAWNLLLERFDNKRLLINNHVSALFNLESLSKESSTNIKRIIDQFNKNLRALESLGEPIKNWDTLLIYIITQKLDSKTFRDWEEYKGTLGKDKSLTLDIFMQYLRNRADLLETLELSRSHPANQIVKGKLKTMVSIANSEPKVDSTLTTNTNSKLQKNCPKCKSDHPLYNCTEFLALTNEQRLKLLPEYKVCYNCLRPGHYANNCKKYGCKVCKRRHNTLIHTSEPKKPVSVASFSSEVGGTPVAVAPRENLSGNHLTLSASIGTSLRGEPHTLLSTALIKIYDNNNRGHTARVLLDPGSTSCLMTEKLYQLLNLPADYINKPIFGINNSKSHTTKMCRALITSLSEDFSTNILCFVLPAITDTVPSRHLDISDLNIPNNLLLADPCFYSPSEVDLVIGANVFWDILGVQKIALGDGKPKLWESRLGWLLCGTLASVQTSQQSNSILCNFTQIDSASNDPFNEDVQNLLTRFWQLEEVGHPSSCYYSQEEKLCEEHFVKNTYRLDEGRFCVRVPLKDSPDKLGDSLERAKRCFASLERKFKAQPLFHKQYVDFMSEYISLGHMTECTQPSHTNSYFIPHHGIIRESSSTTKLRVVFNASSPTTSGLSSNNIQMVGPTVQDDLLAILLRFRQHKYVLVGDVEKMYRQVVVHPNDRHLQQILWRSTPSETVKVYQLNTVTYGTASAPFLATRCLKQVSLDCNNEKIAEIIAHDFYVDDMISGGNTVAEVTNIRQQVTAALSAVGMPLRKWKSNDPRIISDQSESSLVDLNIGATESSKTLGLGWHTGSDELYFTVDSAISNVHTKRSMLSVIAQIFDPLGLLTPGIIKLKIILQQMWLFKLSWDDSLPSDIAKRWCELIKHLPVINDLRIPRLVSCGSNNIVHLHIFSDASQCAFGACVYVRSINPDGGVSVRLLVAKSRVAPIKPTTIPRLELCAALVGVRLYEKVISSLRVKVRHTTFWTDSTIVLGWLKMLPSKLQPFVRNRVAEILEKTVNCEWRHVPTEENPADHISRGVDFHLIPDLNIWWSGPSFLQCDISEWPLSPLTHKSLPEIRPEPEVSLLASLNRPDDKLIDFERFSNFTRLKRTVAYVLRFIHACKRQSIKTNYLNNDELQEASNIILRMSQSETFPEYKLLLNKKSLPPKSPLLKYNVFLDENNLLRVGGRLENSDLSYNKKHPILIQSTHRVAKLLFNTEHLKLLHAGPQLLLASIRESYWPIGGRNLARSTFHRCVRCHRMKGKTVTLIMGNLPRSRIVSGGHPFQCVGVDYAGPILSASRQGRGCRLVKVYVAIFVCFTTKAIHIELVGDLTSNCFLAALRRFISRRGKPSDIYSDNGTSFVGAYNEIGKFLKSNCTSLPETLANDGINFHLIPPYSPHFGGLWEAGVKSIKFHLQRVMGNCNLVYEELNTVLVQIEAVLNSRPLTPMSSDPDDLQPLSPGHFLIGRPLTALPVPDYGTHSTNFLSRFQRIEKLRQHFWSRWSKEYLSELQQRIKWRSSDSSLKVNSLVVLKEDALPPLKWKLGRVISLHPGADGVKRVADVKTATGVVRRSFSKICPLPEEDSSC